jgi:hypothetical protein
MDKLPEPEFQSDKMFPRKLHGVEKDLPAQQFKYFKFFGLISPFLIGKYYRDITFYDKNIKKFLVTAFLFGFAAHSIASYVAYDSFHTAALKNNEREEVFIQEYGKLLKEAKDKNVKIPDELLY